ncbi:MAG: heat-inducible transcriptional repressor HrcA [Bacilli bacterium]
MEMNFRKDTILKLIVESYIDTIKPISSKAICDCLDCSSATVRNEMMELEEMGYLEKEHISSGRIPSKQGYRYYIDYLMQPHRMKKRDLEKLDAIFNNTSLEVTDAISQSLKIVSEMTNYTLINLNDGKNVLRQVEIVPLSNTKLITIIVTESGHVEHRNMTISQEVSITEIKKIVELINKLLVGTQLNMVHEKLEFEIKPMIVSGLKQQEMIYEAFYNVFKDAMFKNEVNYIGKNNILKQPEFNTIDKIRNIMEKLDDNYIIKNMEELDDDIKVYIGDESDIDEDVSMIRVNYGNGSFALVGPKRMDYKKVLPLLEYIKDEIEGK